MQHPLCFKWLAPRTEGHEAPWPVSADCPSREANRGRPRLNRSLCRATEDKKKCKMGGFVQNSTNDSRYVNICRLTGGFISDMRL